MAIKIEELRKERVLLGLVDQDDGEHESREDQLTVKIEV